MMVTLEALASWFALGGVLAWIADKVFWPNHPYGKLRFVGMVLMGPLGVAFLLLRGKLKEP